MSKSNLKIAPALKPRSSIAARITDALVYMPMHGGGTAAINVAGVTRGLTTTVTLGTAPACIIGQTVKLADLLGITELNGYAKVIGLAPSNGVVLDVDSSAYSAWTSGGTMSFNVVADVLGNLEPQDIQGTVTGIWANPADGLTAQTGGSSTNRITTGLDAFDLSAFSGYLVLAFDILIGATPSTKEYIFSLGVNAATGANSAAGTINADIETTGVLQFCFRPQTASDGGGTNLFWNTGAIGNGVQRHVACVIDLAGSQAHSFLDGVLKSSVDLTMTNAIGNPSTASGICIGALIDTSLGLFYKLGSATTTPSQIKVENLLWWKSTKDFSTTIEAVRRYGAEGELNEMMV